MDKSLIDQIEIAIKEDNINCKLISNNIGDKLVLDLTEKFSFDLNNLFIWTQKGASEFYDYSGGEFQWDNLLQSLLDNFMESIYLCVTNEENFPWQVLQCNKNECIKLLTSLPYFEYFIFDASMSFVLFDT